MEEAIAVLKAQGAAAPVKSLTEVRLRNLGHTRANSLRYGQSNLDISDEMDLVADRRWYETDRAKDLALAGTNGVEAVMKAHNLDALLFPGCLLYTSPSPRDRTRSRMPSSA